MTNTAACGRIILLQVVGGKAMNEKSETKLCKYCQTEIPAKAKICPNCRKKQGGATKWFVAVVIVVILLIAIFGGNGENNDAVADSTEQNKKVSSISTVDNKEATREEVSDPDFLVKEYLYENTIGDTLDFLIVTNNSNTDVAISGNATAKDLSGNSIGAADMSIDVLGAGETSIGVFYFDSVSGIDKVDYTLDYNENPYYKPVVNDLSVEQTFNDENVTVSVTNNSTNPALFVSAYAIFFDSSNNVVNYNSTYITDSDSEIKPGKTISDQLDCYGKYDHAEVYFTGRADK